MITFNEVYDFVIITIVSKFEKKIETVKCNSTLTDDLNLDSLDLVDLLFAVESKWNVDIVNSLNENKEEDLKFKNINTIKDLVKFFCKTVNNLKE